SPGRRCLTLTPHPALTPLLHRNLSPSLSLLFSVSAASFGHSIGWQILCKLLWHSVATYRIHRLAIAAASARNRVALYVKCAIVAESPNRGGFRRCRPGRKCRGRPACRHRRASHYRSQLRVAATRDAVRSADDGSGEHRLLRGCARRSAAACEI